MTLEYLLIFGLGLAIASALTGISGGVADFVIDQVQALTLSK